MVYKNTYLIPSNKINIFIIKVIHLYSSFYKKCLKVGFFFKGVCKNIFFKDIFKKKFKKNNIFIRSTFKKVYTSLSFFLFYNNSNLILKKRLTPLGLFIFGPTYYNIKRKKLHISYNYLL